MGIISVFSKCFNRLAVDGSWVKPMNDRENDEIDYKILIHLPTAREYYVTDNRCKYTST